MHETAVSYLRWIVLLPLLGATINGLLNRRLPKTVTDVVAVGSVAIAFGLSVKAFLQLRGLPVADRYLHDSLFAWMPIGDLRVDIAFGVDPLTAVEGADGRLDLLAAHPLDEVPARFRFLGIGGNAVAPEPVAGAR